MKREQIISILSKLKGVEYTEALEKEIVDSIMSENGNDINTLKKEKTDLETKVTELTEKITTVEKEYNDFKLSTLTEEEKQKKIKEDEEKERQAVIDNAKAEAEKYRKLVTEVKIKNVFASKGFVEDDYKDLISGLVLQDEETALKTADSFVKMIEIQRDVAAKKAVDVALKKIPDPQSNGDEDKTKAYDVPLVF